MTDGINKWTGRPTKRERRIRPGQYAREAPPEPRLPIVNPNLTQRFGLKQEQLESIINGFERDMPISELEAELEMSAIYIGRKIKQISRYLEWDDSAKVQKYLTEAKKEDRLLRKTLRNSQSIEAHIRQVSAKIQEAGYEIGLPRLYGYVRGGAEWLEIPILDTKIEMPLAVEDFKQTIEAETSKVKDYRVRISFGYEGNSVVLSTSGSRRDKIIAGIFLEAYKEALEAPTQEMRELASQVEDAGYKTGKPYFTEQRRTSADYAGELLIPILQRGVNIQVAAEKFKDAVETAISNMPDIKIGFYLLFNSIIMIEAYTPPSKKFLMAYGEVLEAQRILSTNKLMNK